MDELYIALLFIPAAIGAIIGATLRCTRWGGRLSILLCMASCAIGVFAYPLFYLEGCIECSLNVPSIWGDYSLMIGDLQSLVISFTSFVFLAILIHLYSSASFTHNRMFNPLVCLAYVFCIATMSSDSVFMLLLSWEMVTLISFAMVSNGKEGPRWRFFVITHLGGFMVVSAFILMYISAGTPILSEWNGLAGTMDPLKSIFVTLLLFMGFGTKLGLIPFHVWMPDLYGSAPVHATTILTTVCSNVAVLVLFNGMFVYMGVSQEMNAVAIVMILISAVTLLWGALESIIQTEAKRILAYSSMENMALVALCMSLSMLFASNGCMEVATMVAVAGIFHAINHSIFKSLMFLTIGTVEDSTGTTSMEMLGGLAKHLPKISMVSLIAVLSMAAIPPFNGFMSEWLVFQSVLGGDTSGIGEMELMLPLVVAVLGISSMLAAASYIRLHGFIFLGRPRSNAVHEFDPVNRATMSSLVSLSALCMLLGVLALPMIRVISTGISGSFGFIEPYESLPSSSLDPLLLAILFLAMLIVLYLINRALGKGVSRTSTWGCGTVLESNMQYSPSGVTQPLVKVFHPLYGDVAEITDDAEHHHKHFSLRFKEPFVTYAYEPIGKAMLYISKAAGRIQSGSIQAYLAYILVTLVSLLIIVRLV